MYKLINTSNIETDDFLDVVLKNRGIDNADEILDPNKESLIHYSKLENMELAVDKFLEVAHSDEQSNIATLVDADIDGNTSAAMFAGYVAENFKKITNHFVFHKGKQHGLSDDAMKQIHELNEKFDIKLLVTPDSATSDIKQHEELFNIGITTIVLDHHPLEDEPSKHAIVVNNQCSPEYDNKQLSGAGIVLKFLEALDDKLGINESVNYLDLAALGNLADSMTLTSPETRYLVYNGFKNIKNEFLSEIIKKNIADSSLIYPMQMSFNVIPKMNGIIRVGSQEEKEDLFKAFLGIDEESYNSRSKKYETLPQKVTRLCTNAHSRQKKQRSKLVDEIKLQIEEKQLNKNAFILVELDDKFNRDLGGLIAGQLAGEYRKPVLMMIHNKKTGERSGSLRGFDGTMLNTQDFLKNLNLFEYLKGHQNACGFSIKDDNYLKLNDAINEAIDDSLEGAQPINVDFVLNNDQVTVNLAERVFEYEYLWGKGLSKPLFAVEVEVDAGKIKKSNSSNMIEWYHKGDWNNVKFVQFNGDLRLIDLIEDGHKVKLTLVGSLSISHFAGRITPQFQIEEVGIGDILTEFTEIEEVDFGGIIDDLLDW